MADSDILIGGEPINADSIGLDKGLSPKKKKQYMIIGGVCLAILIVIIIIIVVVTKSGGGGDSEKSDKSDESNEPKESEIDPSKAIGEINLVYRPRSAPNPTIIISPNYQKTSKFSIYVNNNFVKYNYQYTFEKASDADKVKILIFEEIDMSNMFESVTSLQSIKISSNKNLKIKSLESCFEHCTELTSFNLQGCDTSQITSVKNLFYDTGIEDINMDELPLDNIKDFS